jgi:excisionase family DNA binding protein
VINVKSETLLGPLEIAALLKISPNSVRSLVHRGVIPHADVVLGHRTRRWSSAMMQQWLESKAKEKTSAGR